MRVCVCAVTAVVWGASVAVAYVSGEASVMDYLKRALDARDDTIRDAQQHHYHKISTI